METQQEQISRKVVTIDGPAASGKSSVSREVARRMGWSWVSTGAFYRGLAYVALATQVPLDDEEALVRLAESDTWEVRLGEERTEVCLRNEDVTDQIYREDIGAAASQISQLPGVRESLLQAQRDCVLGVKGLVAEGRDCGTVVFPQAAIKIYLTAQSSSRAQRRALEEGKTLEETQAAQAQRDRQDTHRQASPLQVPEKAHVVDTSEMNLEEVVNHVDRLVRSQLG